MFTTLRFALLALMPTCALAAGGANVELYVESGIRHSARGVAYSQDGRLIAAGSLDRSIIVWDTSTGREVVTLPNRTQSTSLAFLPKTYVVAANGEDGQVQFWDVSRRAKAFPDFPCSERSSPSIALSLARSELLCVDGANQAIRRWDLNTHAEIRPAYSIPGLESTSRLSSNGGVVTVVGADRIPRLIELPSLKTLGVLPTAFSNLEAFAFQPELGLIGAIEEGHGEVKFWTWRGDNTVGEVRSLGGRWPMRWPSAQSSHTLRWRKRMARSSSSIRLCPCRLRNRSLASLAWEIGSRPLQWCPTRRSWQCKPGTTIS